MRRSAIVVSLVLATSCGPGASELPPTTTSTTVVTPTTTIPDATTTTIPDATTTTTLPSVVIELQARELATMSADTTVQVQDTAGMWIVDLDAAHPTATVPLAGTATVHVSYQLRGVDTGVQWQQVISMDSLVISQPWRSDEQRCTVGDSGEPVVLIWQSLGDRASYRAQLDAAPALVNVVSPIWWFVQADGSISDAADAGYVTDVHDRGRAIWPAIAGLDADANHAAFSTATNRARLSQQLSDRARDIGADGINLDIEGYRDEDAPAFTAFVAELVPLVHDWGGVVSYDVIPRTDTWEVTPPELSFWSTAPERRELAALVDCMILMAYDQHNRFRPDGPVAAPAWVEENLRYLLRYTDPQNTVLGLPFYGRIWNPADLSTPRAVGVGRLPSGAGSFDDEFGLEKVMLDDGRFYWNESPEVLSERLGLIEEFGLAGWAAWRFGFDTPSLWAALAP